MDENILQELANTIMPYGKYKGYLLSNLPEPYVAWMERQNAYPNGRLGVLLRSLYEIKVNGLEYLLRPLEIKH